MKATVGSSGVATGSGRAALWMACADLFRAEIPVGAVAERQVGAVFTDVQPGIAIPVRNDHPWRAARARVRTVAERLAFRTTTGTELVLLALDQGNPGRLVIGNDGKPGLVKQCS